MARPVATEHTGLPLKKGRAGTMTHDYKRHGTTTLVAALNVLGRQGHRSQHATASASGVHPLPQRGRGGGSCEQGGSCDPRQLRSAQASKGPPVLDRHERFKFHFTPTSCSWLNAVEGF